MAGPALQVSPVAPPAQGGIPPPFHGFTRQPYQGQCSYGRGQSYHPYSRAPVQGRGCGHGRQGSDMYQVQMASLPPLVSTSNLPEGSPPDDLHFADGEYDQDAALEAPELEHWMIGYSNDSGTPQELEYLQESMYEYTWLANSPPTFLVDCRSAGGVATRLTCVWVGACVCRYLWLGVVAGMGKTNFTKVVPTVQSSRVGGWSGGREAREDYGTCSFGCWIENCVHFKLEVEECGVCSPPPS